MFNDDPRFEYYWNLNKQKAMKIKLESKWSSFKRIAGQIWNGYTTLLLSKLGRIDPRIEKMAAYRRIVIANNCKCVKYYFGFIPYLSCCGCVKEAKIYCEECHCNQGKW